MSTPKAKIEYQFSSHGAGRFSVLLFDGKTREQIIDMNIVRDVNGWRISNQRYSDPQHATPKACAEWFAYTFLLSR